VAFVERSLQNLKTDTLDLLQLHCPPTHCPEVFELLDNLTRDSKLRLASLIRHSYKPTKSWSHG